MASALLRLGVITTIGALLLAACGETINPSIPQGSSAQVLPNDITATAVANTLSILFQGTADAVTARAVDSPTPVVGPTNDFANDPTYAAQQWYTAVANSDGNTIGRYTCAAQQNSASNGGAFLTVAFGSLNALLVQFLPGIEMQIDLSGLQYSTISNNGSQASVSIYGEVSVAIGGAFKRGTMDTTVSLNYENGQWKVCDVS